MVGYCVGACESRRIPLSPRSASLTALRGSRIRLPARSPTRVDLRAPARADEESAEAVNINGINHLGQKDASHRDIHNLRVEGSIPSWLTTYTPRTSETRLRAGRALGSGLTRIRSLHGEFAGRVNPLILNPLGASVAPHEDPPQCAADSTDGRTARRQS